MADTAGPVMMYEVGGCLRVKGFRLQNFRAEEQVPVC